MCGILLLLLVLQLILFDFGGFLVVGEFSDELDLLLLALVVVVVGIPRRNIEVFRVPAMGSAVGDWGRAENDGIAR